MKIGPLVYVEWVDASSNSGWFTYDQAEKWIEQPNWLVKQVGWIIRETKRHLILAGRLEVDDCELIGQLQKIPKTWIIKRKKLK